MTTILSKQYAKFGQKIQSTTKHIMFRATNLRQSREFYTLLVMLETLRRSDITYTFVCYIFWNIKTKLIEVIGLDSRFYTLVKKS